MTPPEYVVNRKKTGEFFSECSKKLKLISFMSPKERIIYQTEVGRFDAVTLSSLSTSTQVAACFSSGTPSPRNNSVSTPLLLTWCNNQGEQEARRDGRREKEPCVDDRGKSKLLRHKITETLQSIPTAPNRGERRHVALVMCRFRT